jgi:hypothetical protein
VFTLRKYVHCVAARLSGEDLARFQRLLRRYGCGFSPSKSESFRRLLVKLDVPYHTIDDDDDGSFWDPNKEQPRGEE